MLASRLEFMGQWDAFLHNVERACRARIEHKGDAYMRHLAALADELFHELRGIEPREELRTIVESSELSAPEARTVEYLATELAFFNDLSRTASHTDALWESGESAKTIKESIETFLKKWTERLPWLEKLLKILNELLSLLK